MTWRPPISWPEEHETYDLAWDDAAGALVVVLEVAHGPVWVAEQGDPVGLRFEVSDEDVRRFIAGDESPPSCYGGWAFGLGYRRWRGPWPAVRGERRIVEALEHVRPEPREQPLYDGLLAYWRARLALDEVRWGMLPHGG